ncbi:glutathione S-transferase family protein [Oryzicola mucosus]|uniref:Glutathione S-transferase family protein n=1 Tax=Oryzicola mucosus TaxID=2767425 RepID=A0A8J6PMX1_9HYPH|nr:glutathione S-transferase family protein [Oryzicola mucosus]MBD0417273.1 glutathione S-transferase family protein [Oryzicola mucosus]
MITFYHAPWSRASGIFWLLEELGEPYEMKMVDIRGTVPEEYRAIQPNKKVPAIVHDGTTVTERAAISIYLCEQFPQAGLMPAPGDPDRAAFLTWLTYADGVMDPVLAAKANGHEYMGKSYSYGSFTEMINNVEKTLSSRPYIAGDRFTAADIQIGGGLQYGMFALKVVPQKPVFLDYVQRLSERPAYKASFGRDMEMAREQGLPGA